METAAVSPAAGAVCECGVWSHAHNARGAGRLRPAPLVKMMPHHTLVAGWPRRRPRPGRGNRHYPTVRVPVQLPTVKTAPRPQFDHDGGSEKGRITVLSLTIQHLLMYSALWQFCFLYLRADCSKHSYLGHLQVLCGFMIIKDTRFHAQTI
jgi:hypothetical protein